MGNFTFPHEILAFFRPNSRVRLDKTLRLVVFAGQQMPHSPHRLYPFIYFIMHTSFLAYLSLATLLTVSTSVIAQTAPATSAASSRLALASAAKTTAPVAAAPRLACTKLDGTVLGLNGQPLVGATVMVKGTSNLYITNSEGKYLVEVPVYQGQVLKIEAIGYVAREIALSDCTAPVVGLELAEGTRIKKIGRRAGQIVRFGGADLQ